MYIHICRIKSVLNHSEINEFYLLLKCHETNFFFSYESIDDRYRSYLEILRDFLRIIINIYRNKMAKTTTQNLFII